jgi:serine/threonine protein kinase
MRRTRKQRGGRLVASGGTKCAFQPTLKCDGGPSPHVPDPTKISLVLDGTKVVDEMISRYILNTKDQYQNYFLYPEDSCELDITDPYSVAEFNRCPIRGSIRAPYMITNLDGGTNLYKLILSPDQYVQFFYGFLNIFDGLVLLHSNNIVHNDIKPGNIVALQLPRNEFKVRMIDFGNITKTDSVTPDRNVDPTPAYEYWSYDLAGIYDPRKDVLEASLNKSMQAHNLPSGVSHLYPKNFLYANMVDPSLKDITLMLIVDWYGRMTPVERYKTAYEQCDIYGLGITLYQLLYRFFGSVDEGGQAAIRIFLKHARMLPGGAKPTIAEAVAILPTAADIAWYTDVETTVLLPLYELVRSMVHINPIYRVSASIARSEYLKILPAIKRCLGKVKRVRQLCILFDPPGAGPTVLPPAAMPAAANNSVKLGIFNQNNNWENKAVPPAAVPAAAVPPAGLSSGSRTRKTTRKGRS